MTGDRPATVPSGRPLVPPGERTLYDSKPGFLYIVIRSWSTVLPLLVVIGLGVLLRAGVVGVVSEADRGAGSAADRWIGLGLITIGLLALARVLWGVFDWLTRRHVLSDVRLVSVRGVINTVRFDLPLRRVQHLAVSRSFLERLFGLGTIAGASSGTDTHEIVWRSVPNPNSVLDQIRAQADRVSRRGDGPDPVPVIGLVGGVGSGKSAVAAEMSRQGCLVSDSDAAVREVLTRPGVIEQLVSWWGEEILDDRGAIDRKEVADRVFGDSFQRRRLEALVHPLVRASRDQLIAKARESGAKGVVVDAPLLFEAGVDADCDAVVFVEAPLIVREARVRDSRGWDPQELTRREKAQMPLEEKRRRSDHVVVNNGTLGDLESRVTKVLATIHQNCRDRG